MCVFTSEQRVFIVFITAGPSTKQYSSIYYPFESGWVLGKKKHGEKHFRYVGLLQAERDRHHRVGLCEQGKSAGVGTSKLEALHAPCPGGVAGTSLRAPMPGDDESD